MNGCKTGVVGKNLTHSYSPLIHKMLGDDNYQIYDIDNVKDFILKRDYKGLNITIPYKVDAMKYVDRIDAKAKEIGSINTIVNNNELIGYNTDYDGFLYMVQGTIKNKVCAVLGTGGASLAIKKVLIDEGAKKIYMVSRTKKDDTITYLELSSISEEIEVIVNTTPVGMYPHINEAPLSLKQFINLKYVYDLIYNPINTFLIQEAKALNIECKSGLDMLIKQAIVADEIFFNKKNNITVDEIKKEILDKQLNIVLIGFPGSGKSTIGKLLSNKLNKKFIDIDEEIVKKYDMSINDIFKNFGEQKFRDIENEMVNEISLYHNYIIATGGGVVLNEVNMKLLKANGIIVNIKRDLDKIVIDNSRPLLKNKDDLNKLYIERNKLYNLYKDYEIENNE